MRSTYFVNGSYSLMFLPSYQKFNFITLSPRSDSVTQGLFGFIFFITQFSSLITHHSIFHTRLAPSLTSHHSIFFTLFMGPISVTWSVFFSPLFFLLSLFFSSSFFHFSFFSLFTFLISDFSSRTKLNMHKYILEQTQISQS